MTNLAGLSLARLRRAIQNNTVSFPSQVPVFRRQSRADIQWRVVELYFIRNWSCSRLGQRYDITEERVRQLISSWARRAIVLGYVREILPLVRPVIQQADATLGNWLAAADALGRGLPDDSEISGFIQPRYEGPALDMAIPLV